MITTAIIDEGLRLDAERLAEIPDTIDDFFEPADAAFTKAAWENYAAALREVVRLRKALKDIKEVSNTATIRQMAHDALEANNG